MPEINYKQLGNRIKQRRKELHVTQEQLAASLGVNPSHISNIENARSYPSLSALFTIADTLHCGIDYLIGEQYTYDKSVQQVEEIDRRIEKLLRYASAENKDKLYKIMEIMGL